MIKIDYTRDSRLSNMAKQLLEDFYMLPHERSPQDAFARAANAFCFGDMELAQRIYDAASLGWFSFASPVLSNAPEGHWEFDEDEKPHFIFKDEKMKRAQPISCFLSHVPDTIKGQIAAAVELAALSVAGGGVGQHFQMRGITDKSPGAIPYLRTSDSNILYYKQGKTRKGSVAAYLDISHPDVEEFISVRLPTGGDANRKCLNIHNAVNITDEFLLAVKENEDWHLQCPHTGDVVNTVRARELWQSMLEMRFRTGEPYLNYIDEANRQLDPFIKSLGFSIKGSNLCNEIHLPTDDQHTAVCCLSSLNVEYWDDWKDTSLVADLITMLDNVLTYFIGTADPDSMRKAIRSAAGFRDLGLGMMGLHSLFQKKMISFSSEESYELETEIMEHVKTNAEETSRLLATERGEPPYLLGTGKRNGHLLAIAPNANSSIIAGCSPCIEPWNANAFTQRTRLGNMLVRNPALEALLKERFEELGFSDEELDKEWKKIVLNDGSVQDCVWLTPEEREVFKTVWETDQLEVIKHARNRQQFIDQGQSVNTFFKRGIDRAHVNKVHLLAFSQEAAGAPLKGLYYLNTDRGRKIEQVGKAVVRDALKDYESQEADECLACHA